MNKSMTGIWITRIALIIVIIGLGWFFFFSPWSSCNRNDQPQYETAKRDTAAQKKIDSLRLQITNYKLQNDSLEHEIDLIEQSRYERIIHARSQREIVEMKPAGELYPKMRMWLTGRQPLPIPSPKERGGLQVYDFDSLDVLSMAKKKIEYEFLLDDNEMLEKEKSNLNLQIKNYKWEVSDLHQIISYKDEQINKLEKIPRTTITARKWYVDAGIIIGSFAVGYLAGKYLPKIIHLIKKLFKKEGFDFAHPSGGKIKYANN